MKYHLPTAVSGAMVAALCMIGAPASAGVYWVDFEAQAGTSPPFNGAHNLLNVSQPGLQMRIYRSSGASFDIVDNIVQPGKPASWGNRSVAPFADLPDNDHFVFDMRMQNSDIKHFHIEFGDYGPSDDDSPVFLQAWSEFGGTGTMLASAAGMWGANDGFPDFGSLSVWDDSGSIRSVTFGSNGSFNNSLYWDNIHIETPEPATLALFGVGLAGLGFAHRRRKAA